MPGGVVAASRGIGDVAAVGDIDVVGRADQDSVLVAPGHFVVDGAEVRHGGGVVAEHVDAGVGAGSIDFGIADHRGGAAPHRGDAVDAGAGVDGGREVVTDDQGQVGGSVAGYERIIGDVVGEIAIADDLDGVAGAGGRGERGPTSRKGQHRRGKGERRADGERGRSELDVAIATVPGRAAVPVSVHL
jgi:hypothetical protein